MLQNRYNYTEEKSFSTDLEQIMSQVNSLVQVFCTHAMDTSEQDPEVMMTSD